MQDYGTTIIVDHSQDVRTLYGHLAKLNVQSGQRVERGALIGYTGNTGREPRVLGKRWNVYGTSAGFGRKVIVRDGGRPTVRFPCVLGLPVPARAAQVLAVLSVRVGSPRGPSGPDQACKP